MAFLENMNLYKGDRLESEDSIDSSPTHYKDDKEWTGYKFKGKSKT